MSKYSVGLDVSAKEIHCCISLIDPVQRVVAKATRMVANTVKGFKELDTWIARHHKQKELPVATCMEATGIYYENCALFLHKAGHTVSVILPNKAKKYLQASGIKSKNDRADARGLAQMGAEKHLDIWSLMGEYFYQLRQLTRHHEDLQHMKNVTGNRLHAAQQGMYTNREVVKQLKKQINLIEKQIAECVSAMEKHIRSNAAVKEKGENITQRYRSADGRNRTGRNQRIRVIQQCQAARQLRRIQYRGKPVGTRVGKTRISKKGNRHIRRAMLMPALVSVTHKTKPFFELYQRTFAKHGIKMKSYVAVQKKLLTTIYAIWKRNEPFDENHAAKSSAEEQELALPLGEPATAAGDAITNQHKKVVPTTRPALHKVSMPSELSPYASSRVEQS